MFSSRGTVRYEERCEGTATSKMLGNTDVKAWNYSPTSYLHII